MDISFDYYKIFYEVARAKSISLAAQHLCLTQPTITKYIQNLEQNLHCQLFIRSRKGVTLTSEGQMLFRQISRAVQQMSRVGNLLQDFVNCQSGKINIGASELTMRYNLLPYLTPLENVLAAMEITSNPIKNKKERARELLTRMGITEDQMNRNINKLSGGEQQRVAIARAISTNAEVILADEPTGNLDVDTAAGIVKIFKELAHEDKKCVIAVTHSEAFAAEADVVVRLEKKKLQD